MAGEGNCIFTTFQKISILPPLENNLFSNAKNPVQNLTSCGKLLAVFR